jgi:hypothetical protein
LVIEKPWGFVCYEANSADDEFLTHVPVGVTKTQEIAQMYLDTGDTSGLLPIPEFLIVRA